MKERIEYPAYLEVFLDVLFRGPEPGGCSEKQISALPWLRRYDFEKVVVHGLEAGILEVPFEEWR